MLEILITLTVFGMGYILGYMNSDYSKGRRDERKWTLKQFEKKNEDN